jgi:hypothetical protein
MAYIHSPEMPKLVDVRLRPDQKIAFLHEGLYTELRVKFCFAVLKQLQGILNSA